MSEMKNTPVEAEIDRLKAINHELLEALKLANNVLISEGFKIIPGIDDFMSKIDSVIKKATP